MRKALILTITFMLNFIVLISADEGFQIILQNTRLETINYSILQLDHGFPNIPEPMVVMGGELASGKGYISPYSRNFGKYIVKWYSSDETFKHQFVFTVLPPTKRIVIYCEKVVYQ